MIDAQSVMKMHCLFLAQTCDLMLLKMEEYNK